MRMLMWIVVLLKYILAWFLLFNLSLAGMAVKAIIFKINQAAHQSGEDELTLSTMGRTYTIDFDSMQQINEDTGTTRSVQRKVHHPGSGQGSYEMLIVLSAIFPS